MKIYSITALLILLTSVATNLMAGIRWIDIGVNGFTCSMCSRSVEMSLRKLDFVDSVGMSLEKTEGRIYLKDVEVIDLKRIAKAITDAGFSVRFVRLQLDFRDIRVDKDGFFTFKGQRYQWLQFKGNALLNSVALTLVDEGFLPKKESNQWKKKLGIQPDQNILYLIHEI
ncbi:MAG: heavy-metal-associated domain-containing protein [Flammeovirgaceae bacterium]|nr:heavy-metal-associated domain-containing protein [Flammeovirgaceae bacterium]